MVFIKLLEQQRIVTLLARRAAPVQQGGLTQHAPAVGVARAKPFGSLAGSQPLLAKLQQHHLTRHVRLQTQLSCFIHQAVGTLRQQQASQQVFAALRPPLKISLLTTLFHEHLGSHLHQFAIHPHLVRLASDTEHAHQLMVEHQRQVDAGLDTPELRRRQGIDFHHLPVGQHSLRAFMTGTQSLGITAADDDAQVVHDIDVVRQDGHGPVDDVLSQRSIKGEHERLRTRGEACNGWAYGYILLKL